jgi:hypothetical protein
LNFEHFREDSSPATEALPRRFRRYAHTPTRLYDRLLWLWLSRGPSPSVQKVFVPFGQEIRQFRQQIRQLGQKAGTVAEFMISDRPNSKSLLAICCCLFERQGRNRAAVAVDCDEWLGRQRNKQIRIPNQFSPKAQQP